MGNTHIGSPDLCSSSFCGRQRSHWTAVSVPFPHSFPRLFAFLRPSASVKGNDETNRWDTPEIRIWRRFQWSPFVAMDVSLSGSRDKISPRVQAPFSLCTTYVATIAFNERIWKYRGYVLRFLAKFWRLTSVNTSYENCHVILCSKPWLKIKVTAWRSDAVSTEDGTEKRQRKKENETNTTRKRKNSKSNI